MKKTFEQDLEKAIKTTLDNTKLGFGNDKLLIRSNLKRHISLLIAHRLDKIIERLVP
jgi:hypothetical protein